MKCPQCLNNHRRKRSGMRCSCGYLFVFDPQRGDKIRDYKMSKLVANASANNTRFFTLNVLYGTFLRQGDAKTGCFVITLAIAFSIFLVPFFIFSFDEILEGRGLTWFSLGGGLAILTILIFFIAKYSKPLSFNEFSNYFERWQKNSYLKSSKFLTRPSLHNPPPTWKENDIYHYGVEKVILLDNDLSVDLWVKNNEHVNHKALILSSDGYPNYLIKQLKNILNRQPEIEIFSLHGLRTTLRRESMRFEKATGIKLEDYKFIDLGFSKQQLQKSKRLNHAYRTLKYDVPLDMFPYASGINLLVWINQNFSPNQYSTSNNSNSKGSLDFDIDFDDFDFG